MAVNEGEFAGCMTGVIRKVNAKAEGPGFMGRYPLQRD
jgi:hypothetical protein